MSKTSNFNYFKKMLSVLFCLVSFVFSKDAFCVDISNLRVGQGIGTLRIVFDSNAKLDYKVFLLNNPQRLVIDFDNTKIAPGIEKIKEKNNLVSNARLGKTGVNGTRIVFDLQKPAIVKKVLLLPPQSNFDWRFVVDLEITSAREFASQIGNDKAYTNQNVTKTFHAESYSKNNFNQKLKKKHVIVLDPGHGGVDPGAIGISGMYEKKITLSMAKELKELLDKTGKYKVYLTRNRDVFIPLRNRVKIARKYDADLFISIHADSAKNRNAKGLSVYTLSENASDKEAAALAEKENKADIVAGLNFAEHSKEVSDILLNLAQRETLNRSSELATHMVNEMKKSIKTVPNTHRFAGFAVLKAPDVPSVLLELGYLSNRYEEKMLKQKSYRKKLAISAINAINHYFENMQ